MNYKKRITFLNRINKKLFPYYCYYDDKGDVIRVSSTLDKTQKYIAISHNEGQDFINFKKRIDHYVVKDKKIKLKDDYVKPITTNFLEVTDTTGNSDIVIIKNYETKTWQFICNSTESIDGKLHFSITQKHNPNVLYRSIDIPINELLKSIVEIDFVGNDLDTKNYSVYTVKKFNTYTLEEKHVSNS